MSNHQRSFFKRTFLPAVVAGCVLFAANYAHAQVVDYNKQYFAGKQLFREGKYNLAMETFKPLTVYDSRNQFSAYASFYYALSAYNQGFQGSQRFGLVGAFSIVVFLILLGVTLIYSRVTNATRRVYS